MVVEEEEALLVVVAVVRRDHGGVHDSRGRYRKYTPGNDRDDGSDDRMVASNQCMANLDRWGSFRLCHRKHSVG